MQILWKVLVGLVMVAPGAIAAMCPPIGTCIPTMADPETVNVVNVDTDTYYIEERDFSQPVDGVVVPGMGFLLGGGTWMYEEGNTIGQMQRGGGGLTGSCFPPPPMPCMVIDEDPIEDQTCGRGPDTIIF